MSLINLSGKSKKVLFVSVKFSLAAYLIHSCIVMQHQLVMTTPLLNFNVYPLAPGTEDTTKLSVIPSDKSSGFIGKYICRYLKTH